MLGHRIHHGARGELAGPPDNERDTHAAFISGALVATQSGLEKVADAAVVAHENHNGIFPVNRLQQPPDVFIHACQHAVDAGVLQGNVLLQIPLDVTVRNQIRSMRGVERKVEQERPVGVLPDKLDRTIRQNVRDVTGHLHRRFVVEQFVGIVVAVHESVLPESEVFVEPAVVRVVFHIAAEVPLPHAGSAIAGLLENIAHCGLAGIQRIAAQKGIDGAGSLIVPAGHQRRTRRRADGRGVEMSEAHTFGGEPVDVRRFDMRVAVHAQIEPALIVGQDEHEIRLCRRIGFVCEKRRRPA